MMTPSTKSRFCQESEFEFEPDDPSVGIFGSYYWHCCPDDAEAIEADIDSFLVKRLGKGVNTKDLLLTRAKCIFCGYWEAWLELEWNPQEDDE